VRWGLTKRYLGAAKAVKAQLLKRVFASRDRAAEIVQDRARDPGLPRQYANTHIHRGSRAHGQPPSLQVPHRPLEQVIDAVVRTIVDVGLSRESRLRTTLRKTHLAPSPSTSNRRCPLRREQNGCYLS